MQRMGKEAQGSRNFLETLSSLIRCVWEAIQDFFESFLGKESTKIVNEAREQRRDEMRKTTGRNAVRSLEDSIRLIDRATQDVRTNIKNGIDRVSSARYT